MSLLPVYLIVAAQQGYPFGTMWERPDSDVGRSGCGCGASASGSGGREVWGIAYEYAVFVRYTMVWSIHFHEVNHGDDVGQDGESA